jgi:hypothetical protein
MQAIQTKLNDEELLRLAHDEDAAEYSLAIREKRALLNRLSVAELRVLLVHYGYAENGRDAKSWPRSEILECLAEHMAESAS